MRGPLIALMIALSPLTPASAADSLEPDAKTAQSVALAEFVPQTCRKFETNRQAIAALLLTTGLTGRDVTIRYADAALAAQDQFVAAAQRDQEAACSQAWDRLGDKGLGLLAPRDD